MSSKTRGQMVCAVSKFFRASLWKHFRVSFRVLYSICIRVYVNACVRCVRRVRARRWRCGARAVRCLSIRVRRLVHVLRCPHKNAKNLEARGQNCTPHPEKKVVSAAGARSPNRHIAPTLLSSDIFLYLCIIKPYYISYG